MPMKTKTITITKPNFTKKFNINNQKAARLRRQRGYHWEDTIVKRFNGTTNWRAFRLGSPSIALPDVLAVNTEESKIWDQYITSSSSRSNCAMFRLD